MQKIKTSSWEFEISASSTLSFLLLACFNFAWHTQFRQESCDTCQGVLVRSSFHAAFIFLSSSVHFECGILTSKSQECLLSALLIGSITEIHRTYTNGVSQSTQKQSDVQSKAHLFDFLNMSWKNHIKKNQYPSINSIPRISMLIPYGWFNIHHNRWNLHVVGFHIIPCYCCIGARLHLWPEISNFTPHLEEFSSEATLDSRRQFCGVVTKGISVNIWHLASFGCFQK